MERSPSPTCGSSSKPRIANQLELTSNSRPNTTASETAQKVGAGFAIYARAEELTTYIESWTTGN